MQYDTNGLYASDFKRLLLCVQVRIHELLMQNQELLGHVGVLVERLLQLEEPAVAKTELVQLPPVSHSFHVQSINGQLWSVMTVQGR